MAHLSHPIFSLRHTAAPFSDATRSQPSGPSLIRRVLLRLWASACHHAERPGRIVPRY